MRGFTCQLGVAVVTLCTLWFVVAAGWMPPTRRLCAMSVHPPWQRAVYERAGLPACTMQHAKRRALPLPLHPVLAQGGPKGSHCVGEYNNGTCVENPADCGQLGKPCCQSLSEWVLGCVRDRQPDC